MTVGLRNMTSLYLVDGDRVLCLFRQGSRVADQKYIGTCGGHFEQNELNDPRTCILREMQEELGISEDAVSGLSLRYITHRLKDGEIRQNYYYFAGLRQSRILESREGFLQWFRLDSLPEEKMPVSARHMIRHYRREGRFTDILYAGITTEEGTCFVPLREFEG